jgi:hypothetical protein
MTSTPNDSWLARVYCTYNLLPWIGSGTTGAGMTCDILSLLKIHQKGMSFFCSRNLPLRHEAFREAQDNTNSHILRLIAGDPVVFSELCIYECNTTVTGLVSLWRRGEHTSVVWTPRRRARHIYTATTSCTTISIYIASYFCLRAIGI